MYITDGRYRQSGCLSGCGVQTSPRRLGFDFGTFLKAAPVIAQSTATVTSAIKGGGGSGGGSSQGSKTSGSSGAGGSGTNFLDNLSSTELAIGGIAGLGLVLALVR